MPRVCRHCTRRRSRGGHKPSKHTNTVLQVCILDGFGSNTEDQWNGIHMAETPVFDSLRKNKERFRWVAAGRSALGRQEAKLSAGQSAS